MRTEILLPDIGIEQNTPLVVSFWFAEQGDELFEGDRLVEILAGSVTVDVPAPASGKLLELRVAEEEIVRCGDVLAVMESDEVE